MGARLGGVGKKGNHNWSFLPAVTGYRVGILTADASGPTGVEGITGYIDCDSTNYAAEMVLNIFVDSSREATVHTATLQVWYSREPNGSSPWYFVRTLEVTKDAQMLTVTNAPPGYYKIIVTDKTAAKLNIYYNYRL